MPKRNITFERHSFRKQHKETGERIEKYMIRLRHETNCCKFGNELECNLKDEVIEKCV